MIAGYGERREITTYSLKMKDGEFSYRVCNDGVIVFKISYLYLILKNLGLLAQGPWLRANGYARNRTSTHFWS